MNLTQKLSSFNPDDLDGFIEKVNEDLEYPIKSSSIRRIYSNWLRNNDERNFEEVVQSKVKSHIKKIEKKKKDFTSKYVGEIVVNNKEVNYTVNLMYEEPYLVSFMEPKLENIYNSLDNFCNKNSLRLELVDKTSSLYTYNIFTALNI